MKRLKLERKKISLENEPINNYNPSSYNTPHNTQHNINVKGGEEQRNPNEMNYEEYVKKAEVDHITLMKFIIFLLFIGVAVFSFYHIFYGENGFESQKEKARQLSELKELKEQKIKELKEKSSLLKKLNEGELGIIEEEARKKGYIYPDETVIKLIDKDNTSEDIIENKNINSNNKNEEYFKGDYFQNLYLMGVSILATIIIIILTFFFNAKKTKNNQ